MLKQRVLTAIALLAGFGFALFYLPQVAWLALVALICAGGAWEWGGLARVDKPLRVVFAITIGASCFGLGWLAGLAGQGDGARGVLLVAYLAGAAFWLLLVPLWLHGKWHVERPALALATGCLVLLPPALALAHFRMIDALLLLGVMALVWVADIAAYFAGRAFGRNKLAPTISPGKTWEGAVGGGMGVIIVGCLLLWTAYPQQLTGKALIWVLPALVLFTAVSIIGDLFESLLKRQAGLKDSGSLLPGHGGILDRIDSLTSTLPLTGLAVVWWLI
jgi:phosphatidate cytidylyltransferase